MGKKVFMFSSVHVWSDTRIYFKEALTLATEGFEVDFYAVAGNETPTSLLPTLKVTTLSKGGKLSRPKRWYYLYKTALSSDADYYHFHDVELLFFAPLLKKRKPNSIVIYDMHENVPAMIETKEWVPSILRAPLAKVIAWLEKKWLPACDGVIYAETSYRQHYQQLTMPQLDLLNYPTWQDKLSLAKNESFTFIYVGDLVIDRGVYNMLQLIETLKKRGHTNIHLKLIGPMQPKLLESVKAYILAHELTEHVTLYGRLPYPEIWQHYASAHVGLCLLHPIPNYLHSLATKLFEYMAAGLPILATNIPDWQELVKNTETGLTGNVFDSEELADQSERLINDEQLRKEFSENGRQAFETTYNWTTEAQKLTCFYQKLSSKVLKKNLE